MFSVIFEVLPREGRKAEYLDHAKSLKPILEGIDGFIDNERFASRDRAGWVLSHSTWRDEKSLIRWRTEARHHLIQEKGRFEVFADYHLRVGEVSADTHPPAGAAVREQRFDATEVGKSKLCMLIELTPRTGNEFTSAQEDFPRSLGLDPRAAGLDSVEVYDSIYNSGKVLVLASWADAASAFEPDAVADAESTRCRAVRVIRDYGMFDRREAPQYYREAPRDIAMKAGSET